MLLLFLVINESYQFELKCKFERVGWDDIIGPAYTCAAMNLNLTQPRQLITTVIGEHPVGAANDKVNTVLAFEQVCDFFPVGLEKFFKNLTGIAIQKSGLKRISKSDLKPFGQLRSISLFGNKLKTLESDLFMYNPLLELISLFANQIKHVHPNVLNGLTRLKHAYFNSNVCIDEDGLTEEQIGKLKCKFTEKCPATEAMMEYAEVEMEKLKSDVENAKLKENLHGVTKHLMATRRKLERSQESYKLVKIHLESNGTGSCVTRKVELMKCEAEKVELRQMIEELEIVEIVCHVQNRSKCEVTDLKVLQPNFRVVSVRSSDKTPMKLETIEELSISKQQVLFLPLNLSDFFPNLSKLSIVDSELMMSIDEKAFRGFDRLTELNLSNNKLVEIRAESFLELSALTKLDLSHNRIETVDASAFESLINLEELLLNNNLLTRLGGKMFARNKKLKALVVNDNKISQIASNFFDFCCGQLHVLDLTNNVCIDAKFPENSFEKISEDFDAHCTIEFEFECRFESSADYSCIAENVAIESRNVKVTKIKGEHLNNSTNVQIKVLKIFNQSMEFMPQDLGKFFSNVERISIESSSLREFDKESLSEMTKIKELIIRDNKLTELHEDSFDDLTNLEVLDCSHNYIANISNPSLSKLKKLKTINFSHNNLTSLELDMIPAKNVIESFIFSHNQLTSIDPQIIKELKAAKLITFEKNKCIDSKYDGTRNNEKKVMEIYGETAFKCIDNAA